MLRDGSVCHLRPIRPEDKDAVQAFHMRQSAESVYLRFFAPIKQLSARDLDRFTVVDNVSRVGLVATVRDEIIGIGRFDLIDADKAEVAFNISDHYQGKGIGSVLLEHLAAIGLELGVKEFVADVLPQNRKMMNVFTDAGYEVSHHFEDGVIAVSFEIAPTVRSEVVRLSREHRAESMSIRTLLAPRSVVVVGASRRPDSAGHRILADILDYGFTGSVYVVHPEADELLGLTPYRRIVDIGEPVDLAVIAVPAEQALACVEDCAAAGVRSLVVLSAGFAEAGRPGGACSWSCATPLTAAGCACSARTATAWSTPTRRCGSTPPPSPTCHRPATWACSCRAVCSPSRCSGLPSDAASASRRRRPPATGSTSPATTSCSTGSTTTPPSRSACTSSRSATRASSPASPVSSAWPSRSSW
ncbi:hypothetical protein GCM10025862_15070 [Arsenicicoccus piscis]|uniref:N-acetyltransferase domain-containing protein n=1 Tax=Arsenicicoccus piscis TaxID=673954 RepID=A0ABQ6HM85_9MICO|nr:hypothetical protein GCM10025862_15070 [Arsenicicoccus piscis]